ncbi:MAG: cytochrome c oxidase subunit 2A [Candidatus Latescibacterota bacterium]|jgi:hypothetical protein
MEKSQPDVPETSQDQDLNDSSIQPDEEPVVTGTIFLTLIMLMMIFGFWAVMYVDLLNR